MNEFVRRLLGKFVQIDKIKTAKTVDKVNFEEESQQLKDGQLFIGFATRQLLNKLVDEGYIDQRKRDQFYQAVHHFYQRAALEAISKLPLQDDTLIHARFVDFFQRENASLEDVEFFLKNYPPVLPTTARETHLLQEEFVEYQLLSNEDISLIRKNKTAFRPSLQVDGTQASLKMANKESSFEPPADLLSSAKKATWNYNKEHLTRGSE